MRSSSTRLPGRRKKRGQGVVLVKDVTPNLLAIPHPPPINPQIVHRQRFRFATTANVSQQNITFQNLLDMLLVATSATAVYDVFDVVRLKSVEVWSLAAGIATAVTVEIQFPGGGLGAVGDGRTFSDTSVSESPAHLHVKPQKNSGTSFWQGSTTAVAFQMTIPTGSIVDVDVVMRNAVVSPVLAQNVAVAASVGQFYYRGLDGLAIATTKFTPQGSGPDTI